MNNIKANLIQVGNATIQKEVNIDFQFLITALKKNGLSLTLKSSYLSSYDIVDELRKKINPEAYTTASNAIKELLDPETDLSTFVQETEKYTTLKNYIIGLSSTSFNPPLGELEPSLGNVSIAPIPHYPATDPRGYGVLITPNDDELKLDTIKTWLLNNSVLYGFVLYGDHSLLHSGKEVIKTQLKNVTGSAADNLLKEIVSKYLPKDTPIFTLDQTAAEVIKNTYVPPYNPPPVAGSLGTGAQQGLDPVNALAYDLILKYEGTILEAMYDVSNWRIGHGSSTFTLTNDIVVTLDNKKNLWPTSVDRETGALTYTDIGEEVTTKGQAKNNGYIWKSSMSSRPQQPLISRAEADRDLVRRVTEQYVPAVLTALNKIKPTAGQTTTAANFLEIGGVAALASIKYNYGNITEQGALAAASRSFATGNKNILANHIKSLSDGPDRRKFEAKVVISNSMNVPV